MTNQPASDTPNNEILGRIKSYLTSGGLFNPEMAIHDAVRDLLIGCRDELTRLSAEREKERMELDECKRAYAEREKLYSELRREAGIPYDSTHLEAIATLAERDRQLAEANAKIAKCIHELGEPDYTVIEGLQKQLADSQRQKAELEGKVIKALEFARDEIGYAGNKIICDAIQSLRQSTQTEERK